MIRPLGWGLQIDPQVISRRYKLRLVPWIRHKRTPERKRETKGPPVSAMASHTSTPREDTVDWGTPSQQRSNPSTGQSNDPTPPQNIGTTTQQAIEVNSSSTSSVQEVRVRPPSNGVPPPEQPEDAREQHGHVSGGQRRRYDEKRKRSSIPADRRGSSRGHRRRSTAYRNTSSSSSISPPRRSTRPSRLKKLFGEF